MRIVTGELGWCVAQMWINDEGIAYHLNILSASQCEEDYLPAESVGIKGRGNIEKLQQFLNQYMIASEVTISPKEIPCQPTDASLK